MRDVGIGLLMKGRDKNRGRWHRSLQPIGHLTEPPIRYPPLRGSDKFVSLVFQNQCVAMWTVLRQFCLAFVRISRKRWTQFKKIEC